MNVNILAANPDWRWSLLTGVLSLMFTFLGWVIFKYFHVSQLLFSSISCASTDTFCSWRVGYSITSGHELRIGHADGKNLLENLFTERARFVLGPAVITTHSHQTDAWDGGSKLRLWFVSLGKAFQ
jgi:hypothetical protein